MRKRAIKGPPMARLDPLPNLKFETEKFFN